MKSIASLQANTINLTPSIARIRSPEQVPSIETIVVDGEELYPKEVAVWWGKSTSSNSRGRASARRTVQSMAVLRVLKMLHTWERVSDW